jgi:hypothetical protein
MSQISYHKSAIVNCKPLFSLCLIMWHLGFCWIKGYCRCFMWHGSRRWSFASTDPRRLNTVLRLIRIHIMAVHSPSRRSWEPVLLDQAGKSAVVDGCPKSCPIEMPRLSDFPAMDDDTGGSTSLHVGPPQSVMGILHWWDAVTQRFFGCVQTNMFSYANDPDWLIQSLIGGFKTFMFKPRLWHDDAQWVYYEYIICFRWVETTNQSVQFLGLDYVPRTHDS